MFAGFILAIKRKKQMKGWRDIRAKCLLVITRALLGVRHAATISVP